MLRQQNKKYSNHRLINILKNLNIDEMCNALLPILHITASYFRDFQFTQTKNQPRRQISVHLSGKLTKDFEEYLKALLIFFSQEIYLAYEIRI